MKEKKDLHIFLRGLVFAAFAAVFVWGIAEAGCGLMQALGWRSSRHALYALTGHFRNPGPFGGFVACVMAVAGAFVLRFPIRSGMTETSGMTGPSGKFGRILAQGIYYLAWAALGLGVIVLPASMSRAGWLALAVALAVEALRLPRVRNWVHGHRWVVPTSVLVTAVLLVGAFLIKSESALGRLQIWRMECRAIAERPWTGSGPGMLLWAYGEAQEAFFRAHLETVPPAVIRAAGCPEYAFNEFLGLGVEYGLPALMLAILLVVSAVVVLHRADSPFAAGLTAWAVFACASYPLSTPQLRILGLGFILVAILAGCSRIQKHPAGLLPLVVALLLVGWMGLHGSFRETGGESFRQVYARGRALHLEERYEESSAVLELGAKMSCDPMFEIILGKNAEALGDVSKAEALYEKAHYMVPSRLYPLVRLMRLQIRMGRNQEALQTAQRIVSMPVNARNDGMVMLHRETESTLDSLKNVVR